MIVTEYRGEATDYNAIREYFKHEFTSLNRSKEKEVCLCFDFLACSGLTLDVQMFTIRESNPPLMV